MSATVLDWCAISLSLSALLLSLFTLRRQSRYRKRLREVRAQKSAPEYLPVQGQPWLKGHGKH